MHKEGDERERAACEKRVKDCTKALCRESTREKKTRSEKLELQHVREEEDGGREEENREGEVQGPARV